MQLEEAVEKLANHQAKAINEYHRTKGFLDRLWATPFISEKQIKEIFDEWKEYARPIADKPR